VYLLSCIFRFRMEYFDDLASGQCADQPPLSGLPAIAVKNFHLTGVKAYCDEFPAACRTMSHMYNSKLVNIYSLCSYRNYSDTNLLVMFMTCEILYYYLPVMLIRTRPTRTRTRTRIRATRTRTRTRPARTRTGPTRTRTRT